MLGRGSQAVAAVKQSTEAFRKAALATGRSPSKVQYEVAFVDGTVKSHRKSIVASDETASKFASDRFRERRQDQPSDAGGSDVLAEA
jgi:hypothetical protein